VTEEASSYLTLVVKSPWCDKTSVIEIVSRPDNKGLGGSDYCMRELQVRWYNYQRVRGSKTCMWEVSTLYSKASSVETKAHNNLIRADAVSPQ